MNLALSFCCAPYSSTYILATFLPSGQAEILLYILSQNLLNFILGRELYELYKEFQYETP